MSATDWASPAALGPFWAGGEFSVGVEDLLRRGGFAVEVSERIQRDVWFKLWGNMTMNPLSATTGATMDVLHDDPGACSGRRPLRE